MILAPDQALARASVRAAADAVDPRLGPVLAAALAGPSAGPALADALAACGAGVEPLAGELLADGSAREHAYLAARVLGGLPTPEAALLLTGALGRDDERVRGAAARALVRLTSGAPDVPMDRSVLIAACRRELTAAYEGLLATEELGPSETAAPPGGTRSPSHAPRTPEGASALLKRALDERSNRARERAFCLLAALYPGRAIDRAYDNLDEPDPVRRANAVELLDSALPEPLRALAIPLVDDTAGRAKLAAVSGRIELSRRPSVRWVEVLLADRSPWMLACARYYSGVVGIAEFSPRLRELAAHPDPVVRESAATALEHLRIS